MCSNHPKPDKNNTNKIVNSIKYASILPPDFSVVLLKDYMAIEENYKQKLILINNVFGLYCKSNI